MTNKLQIPKFRQKFTINILSVAIPGVTSILIIPLLFRIAPTGTIAIIMWTWFLGGIASTVNVGLIPSLTNSLGENHLDKSKYCHLLLKYLKASNSIFLVISSIVIILSIIKSDFSFSSLPTVILQLFFVWLTGINSLIFNALNFEARFTVTALSKLIGNTLVLAAPVVATWFTHDILTIILTMPAIRLLQSIHIIAYCKKETCFLAKIETSKLLSFHDLKSIFLENKLLVAITSLQFSYSFIDRSIVMFFGGNDMYSEYGALLDILTKVWMIANIFIIILHPKLSDIKITYSEKIKACIKYTGILASATVPFLLIVVAFTKPLLDILYGYSIGPEMIYAAKSISISLILSQFIIILNVFYIATRDFKFLLYVTLTVFVTYTVLSLPVYYHFGVKGLATMMILKFTFEIICYWYRFLFLNHKHKFVI